MKKIFGAVLLWMVGCSEIERFQFHHYRDAKSSGFVEKGWIPEGFPQDSENIRLAYRMDTNEGCILFDYKSQAFNGMDSTRIVGQNELLDDRWNFVSEQYCNLLVSKPGINGHFSKIFVLDKNMEYLLYQDTSSRRGLLLFKLGKK